MSTILLSKTFISNITSIIRRFWWTGVQEDNSTFLSILDLGMIFAGPKRTAA
jgi:hypothetical protein